MMTLIRMICLGAIALQALTFASSASEPLLNSWYTDLSGRYAQLFETAEKEASLEAVTTWSHGQGNQLKPVYAGVHEIRYDADWVYVRTSGLPFHIMGPWYNNVNQTNIFGNYPANLGLERGTFRVPRDNSVGIETDPKLKDLVNLGIIGFSVDGVAIYDFRDAMSYHSDYGVDITGNAGVVDGNGAPVTRGQAIWNRDAYHNEGVSFDSAYAHQGGAIHHYHASPIGLRYLLDDNVDYDEAENIYTERVAPPTKHSPIIGWAKDGFPVYGPYGYSDRLDKDSTVVRMISGYQIRSFPNNERLTLPQWSIDIGVEDSQIGAEFQGPDVGVDNFQLGHYLEDYEYRGDVGQTIHEDFHLDHYNGRECVTPEFPNGTYAYFIATAVVTNPATAQQEVIPYFPYVVGRRFYGNARGGTIDLIDNPGDLPETVENGGPAVQYFSGPSNYEGLVRDIEVDQNDGDVVLFWDAAEGGNYRVETSTDEGGNWETLPVILKANSEKLSFEDPEAAMLEEKKQYRVSLDSLDEYDNSVFDLNQSTPAKNTVITVSLAGTGIPPANLQVLPDSILFNGAPVIIIGRPSQYEVTLAAPAGLVTTSYTVNATWGSDSFTGSYSHTHKDNILLMIVDDWGIDHSPVDNTSMDETHFATMAELQRIAEGGMRFTRAYANPTCSPTRATILTGRQAHRTSVGSPPGNGFSVEVDEITIPDVFTSNNSPYQMASFGKWHLSGGNTGYIDRGGWPHFAGSNDNPAEYEAWVKNRNGITSNSITYTTTDQVNEAKAFIDAQEKVGNPWFVWMGFNAPHAPFHNPPGDLIQGGAAPAGDKRRYIRMLEALDTEISRLFESIDQSRTNIMIIGDNGTPNGVVQSPYGLSESNGVTPTLSRGKGRLFEGGIHVPLLIKGPAVTVNQGSTFRTSDKMVNSADLYATVLELAGLSMPANAGQDSVSLVPILEGTDTANRYASSEVYEESTADPEDGRSLRLSDYPDYKFIARGNPNDRFDEPSYELYDLSSDPNETTNLVADNGVSAGTVTDARALISGTALEAFDACIVKHETLGGGFSEPSAGTPQILYLELPTGGGSNGAPNNLGLIPDSVTVDGIDADILGRLDQNDVEDQYWVKCIVPQAASYSTAIVDFPDHPTRVGDTRIITAIQIIAP